MIDPNEPIDIEIDFEYYETADFRVSKTLDFLEESFDD